jgi:hypothetical protein
VGVTFTIPRTGPSCFVTRLGIVVPDLRFTVSRALIRAGAKRNSREHQHRQKNKSSGHRQQCSEYSGQHHSL